MNKQQSLTISVFVLIFFVCIFAVWIIFSSLQPILPSKSPVPIPTSITNNNSYYLKNPSLSANDTKLLDKIENRQALSQQDQKAKSQIIANLGNTSGSPVTTNAFRVDYIQADDLFQVEILITNTKQAENDAITWFLSQGMTRNGICKLPVSFYVNYYIRKQGVNVNPLAEGC